ncbi:MAG: tetratricopeptide repeat protein [bacterium]
MARETPPPKASPGPAICADCHPDETEGYLATGMGRSLYRPQSRPPIEDFTAATVTNGPFVYRAYVDTEGRWWQEETVPGTEHRRRVEVTHVIGSGNHTRSYLGLVEGEVVELPLTWYSRRKIWDMSPGYEGGGNQRFTRPIKPDCLFCHNDLAQARPDRRAAYTEPLPEGISCVRCHGDASAHVAERTAGKGPPAGQPDPSILNPRRLDATRRLQICQQCHLQGEERVLLPGQRWDAYEPGTPLASYLSTFVYADDRGTDFSIASHGHRLSLSRCATQASGGLPCTTCHDPHKVDRGRAARDACLGCHQIEDCGDAHGARDQPCARCHMKQGDTSDIPHVTFTDHYIRKRVTEAPGQPEVPLDLVDALAEHRTPETDTSDQALLRLGIAHARLWRYDGRDQHLVEAHRRLTDVLGRLPDAVEGWLELAPILGRLGDLPGAARAFERIERLSPMGTLYRTDQAEVLENLGDLAGAERTLRRAVELDPGNRVAVGNLANVLQKQNRLADAETFYAKAEALAPEEALTAINRAFNFMQLEQPAEAERWFREAARRDAANPRGLFGLGLLALQGNRLADAGGFFDQALRVQPDFTDGLWMRGRLALQRGQLADARRDLERLVTLQPQHLAGYLDLAEVEARAGSLEARRAVLQRGLAAMPGHPALLEALNAR